ncbi:MAG TPA: HWE histidine kinase domain-containing protein [Rhizomicrobium sp.]|nr:HWE histidine kinase domain-containing protein [Rhizomicrobium sp.]
MRTIIRRAWTGLRDRFSANVLGTTSALVPGLDGGLSRPARLAITAAALALALMGCMLVGAASGVLFFFPALMIAGIFGGAELALPALLLSVLVAVYLFPGLDRWLFAGAAAAQTAIALLMRQFFRESRRWGVRYRRLLGAMSSAVTVSDGNGRIERPHPELARLIGMEWPAYRGVKWLGAIHPDDQARLPPPASFKTVTMQRAEIRLRDPASGDWRWHLMRAVPLLDDKGEVEEWISLLTDIHERKLSGEQQDMMVGEARHRLKNLMTIIDSLAKSSRPREPNADVEAFQKRFLGRLHALSAASDLALASNYTTMEVHEVVAATLGPFLETGAARLTFGGPKLVLSQATGGSLALGVHELTTNAIKHGALSVPGGRAAFTWSVTPTAGGKRVEMTWQESGGPPPTRPDKDGYGARVIGFIPSREQNGSVTMDYPPDGYVCRIAFTMPEVPRVKTLEAE